MKKKSNPVSLNRRYFREESGTHSLRREINDSLAAQGQIFERIKQ